MIKDAKFKKLMQFTSILVWIYLILYLSGCDNILLIITKIASVAHCIIVVIYTIQLIAERKKPEEKKIIVEIDDDSHNFKE